MESAPATHQGCELRSGGRSTAFARIFRFRVAGFIAVRTQELVSQFEPFFDFRPSRNLVKCIPGMLISMNQLSQINGTPGA